jgi:uncharacterized protein
MLEELDIHNLFRESIELFVSFDPQLKKLQNCPYIYKSPMIEGQVFKKPGVFLLTGGRQTGKTTFIKQYISHLLQNEKTDPRQIIFITGEIVDSHHILRRLIQQEIDEAENSLFYIFIDEVNYINDWDRTIKYLYDAGIIENCSVILTGSDSQIIKEAMKRFAGRRGPAGKVDFTYNPLSFKEYRELKHDTSDRETLLGNYLLHGGYLPAINDFELYGTISKGTILTYLHWISGDILKHNKTEHYLYEILEGIFASYGTQISWNSMAKHLSIEHHKTVSDYAVILENMHVLHIVQAIREDKLSAAPKKSKKLYLRDPFIYHCIHTSLEKPVGIDRTIELLQDNDFAAPLIEGICIDYLSRSFPVYYIKGKKGEVDIAVVIGNKMVPIEIKWSNQIRIEELKQIRNYDNGLLIHKGNTARNVAGIRTITLIDFLSTPLEKMESLLLQ